MPVHPHGMRTWRFSWRFRRIHRIFNRASDSSFSIFLAMTAPSGKLASVTATASFPNLSRSSPTFHVREQNPSGCWVFAHRSSLHGISRRYPQRFAANHPVTRVRREESSPSRRTWKVGLIAPGSWQSSRRSANGWAGIARKACFRSRSRLSAEVLRVENGKTLPTQRKRAEIHCLKRRFASSNYRI